MKKTFIKLDFRHETSSEFYVTMIANANFKGKLYSPGKYIQHIK